MLPAGAALVLLEEFAGEEGGVGGVEVEVVEDAVVDVFDFLWPVGLCVVAASLVEEDASDGACLLCFFGAFYEAAVGVVVVLCAEVL